MPERVLVVDDDGPMLAAMQQALARKGFDVDAARDGGEALDFVARRPYDLVVTDLRMPGMDGRELVRRIRMLSPSTRVVVVTAHGTVETAVGCVRDGAADVLVKPFAPAALLEAAQQGRRPEAVEPTDRCVAHDPAMLQALALARRAAACDATLLLEAESGAGKEVVARLVHDWSARARGPFVAVNCAALPRDLLEAELFGHSRGAFTGALRDRKGHFQAADGGTLLLDEIGETSPDLQARLLRVLQDRIVRPVGTDAPVHVDVRVVAATNSSLRDLVAAGRFREDLYYRLNVLPIRIPPLRERPADIEPLARAFTRRFGGRAAALGADALERLERHAWPGNVRELENAIQRAVILSGGEPIAARHVILEPAPRAGADARAASSLDEAEREAIRRVLAETRGNRAEAAAALGIAPRTLRYKLKRYRDEGRPVESA
jgi:two-component system response regulator FlrC